MGCVNHALGYEGLGMNLLDAIAQAQAQGRWFRPVSYRGTGEAFGVWGGSIICFRKNFCAHYVPSELSELTGEWELVSRQNVISERELL